MMKKICPTCGRGMSAYKVSLTRGLVSSLIKFLQAVHVKNKNKIHLQRDLLLTKNEYNNFQKLRYHGLIAKYKENGENVSGYWLLTRRSSKFLYSDEKISKSVFVFNNRIVSRAEEKVTLTDVYKNRSVPYFEKITNIEYQEVFFDENGQGAIL